MKGLASFVMRGPSQAVMATSVLALLSLLLPLLGILSAACVGLVTLRQGVKHGLGISLLATLACGVLIWISFGNPLPSLGFLIVQWMPMLLLGLFLRSSRSLNLTIQVGLVFGLLVIAGQYLFLGDPVSFWQTQLEPLVEQLVQAGVLTKTHSSAVVQQMARWMSGVLAAGVFLQLIFSLLVSRWWQSLLYNPGGFRTEFHGFRLHRLFGVLGVPALVLLVVVSGETPELVRYLGVLLLAILFIQGLAVIHGLLGMAGAGIVWLIGLYLLLILVPPQAAMVLATMGLLDIWIDFRARYARRRSAG
jgi:hypothetical protein